MPLRTRSRRDGRRESAIAVHREAHGLLADRIDEVVEGS
jgi:hypothetical protein